jgi:serine/threonine protein kinase
LLRLSISHPEEVPSLPGFEILKPLGEGGMGRVYLARQEKLDRTVAVKVLPSELAEDPAFVERFSQEARALAALSHPNIVTVHEFGATEAHSYLVMEHVEGETLRQRLGRGLPPKEAVDMMRQLCDALEYAHAKGIVHRDIKPENIFIAAGGRVKLGDFGLAKLVRSENPGLTRSREGMGTPHYMAPEQYSKAKEVDSRADIFSLGVVLYEMLTGQLPVGRFDPPSALAKTAPHLDRVVLKALESNPDRRYLSAASLRADLNAAPSSLPQKRVDPPRSSEARRALGLPIAIWAGCALVLLASFLDWGSMEVEIESPLSRTLRNSDWARERGLLRSEYFYHSFTAWNSWFTLGEVRMCNWFPFFAALGIAFLAWLRVARYLGHRTIPELCLGVYGTLHSVVFASILGSDPTFTVEIGLIVGSGATARIEIGLILTLISFVALIVLAGAFWIGSRPRPDTGEPAHLTLLRMKLRKKFQPKSGQAGPRAT